MQATVGRNLGFWGGRKSHVWLLSLLLLLFSKPPFQDTTLESTGGDECPLRL